MRTKRKFPTQSQKLTDFYPIKPAPSSPFSLSSPHTIPQPLHAQLMSPTAMRKRNTISRNAPLPPDMEVISISSTSVRSHISLSSDSVAPSAISQPHKPSLRRTTRQCTPVKRSSSLDIQYFRASNRLPDPLAVRRRKKPRLENNRGPETRKSGFGADANRLGVAIPDHSSSRSVLPLLPMEDSAPCRLSALRIRRKQPICITISSTIDEIITTSQSDEHELSLTMIPPKDPEEVKASVDRWRADASGTPGPTMSEVNSDPDAGFEPDLTQSEVDLATQLVPDNVGPTGTSEALVASPACGSSACERGDDEVVLTFSSPTPLSSMSISSLPSKLSGVSETEDVAKPNTEDPPLTSARPTTPASSHSPRPPTPLPLSVKAKTDQIIAQIKAAATSAALWSPEPTIIHFPDTDGSDDDEEMLGFLTARAHTGQIAYPSTTTHENSSSSDSASHSGISTPLRRSARQRVHGRRSSMPSTPSTFYQGRRLSSSSETPSTPTPPRVVTRQRTTQSQRHCPFAQLLREKRLEEKKQSAGLNSVSRAEDALKPQAAPMPNASDALDEIQRTTEWGNEDAALKAIREISPFGSNQDESPSRSPRSAAEFNEEKVGRLIGKEKAKVVGDILGSDRQNNRTASVKLMPGESFWIQGVGEGNQHQIERFILDAQGSPILRTLERALDRRDFALVSLVLDSGILETIPLPECGPLVPWLFTQAMSYVNSPLAIACYHALSRMVPASLTVSFDLIKKTLLRLGASPSIYKTAGWGPISDTPIVPSNSDSRNPLLYRLVALVSAAARARRIPHDDINNLLLALHLIGMDPTTSADLRRELVVAIDTVCDSMSPDGVIVKPLESEVCTRLLEFSSDLALANKSLFVSFLDGGSGRTRRIARWIAYGLLTGQRTIPQQCYQDLPPLESIINQLQSFTASSEKEGSDHFRPSFSDGPAIDYEDIGHYIRILGVALSAIDAYTEEETLKPPTTPIGLEAINLRDHRKTSPPLETIKRLLHASYEKILDRGGAFLDRSRAKAAIQHLELRLEYQQLAALKRCEARRRHNFRAFFRVENRMASLV